MANYREGDSVCIHGCNYEVTDYYLSAKSNGSYPKVLAKILWISDLNAFVQETLWYNRHEGKVFGFASQADCAKLINALQNFKGVAVKQSDTLKDASIKRFFESIQNLESLEATSNGIEKVMANFNNIKNVAANILTKISAKNDEFVQAIDGKHLASIKRVDEELARILRHVTDIDEVLAHLNEIGGTLNVETVEFNVDEFLNGEA